MRWRKGEQRYSLTFDFPEVVRRDTERKDCWRRGGGRKMPSVSVEG